jgi:small GTP-binding protein
MGDDYEEVKMILLGESGVGKTAIIKRYLYDQFNKEKSPSESMHYMEKDLVINKKKIKLNVWDTIGQEKYRSLSKLFLNETQIVILVYSIDDSKSFKELDYWSDLYKEQLGDEILLGIVGNKIDLFTNQEVSENQGKEYAEQHNGIFAQLSAKENRVGIEEYILKLVTEYLKKKNNKINIKDFEIIEHNRKKGIILTNKQITDLGYNEDGCCGGKAKARKKKYENILKNNKGCIDSIFLGSNGVGKTSLIKRIDGKDFDENEAHTEELNKYETEYTNANMQITLNIYDINNDEKEKIIIQETIKKCQIYFLVYEIDNLISLKHIQFWIKVIQNFKKNEKQKDYTLAIIGNKKDLKNSEENLINANNNDVVYNKAKNLANEVNGIFYITTAKEDKDIKDIIGIAIENYINLP